MCFANHSAFAWVCVIALRCVVLGCCGLGCFLSGFGLLCDWCLTEGGLWFVTAGV